jgi:mono/diheme cytochrome c family protein
VRITGIRVSESLHKGGEDSLTPDLKKMTSDKDGEVVLQALMTAKHLRIEDWHDWLTSAQDKNDSRAVQELAPQLVRGGPAQPRQTFTKSELKVLKKGEGIYRSLCFACHGKNGKGMPIPGDPKGATLAASFLKNRTILGHPSMSINVVLHGLTGPVDGKTYPNQMIPMKSYDDEWVSSVLSYVRNSFGNRASFITKEQVAATRKATAARKEPWTIEVLRATVPQYLPDRKKWKLSASHNTGKVGSAVDGNLGTRFDTATVMVPGMWFQIELPEAMDVSGLRLDSAGSVLDYPNGYEVAVSVDGKSWSPPLVKGKGTQPLTEIYFSGVKAKFIKIIQTGRRPGKYWSIHDLQIFGK